MLCMYSSQKQENNPKSYAFFFFLVLIVASLVGEHWSLVFSKINKNKRDYLRSLCSKTATHRAPVCFEQFACKKIL